MKEFHFSVLETWERKGIAYAEDEKKLLKMLERRDYIGTTNGNTITWSDPEYLCDDLSDPEYLQINEVVEVGDSLE